MKLNLIKIFVILATCIIGTTSFLSTPTYADPPADFCNSKDVTDEAKEAVGCPRLYSNKNSHPKIVANIIEVVVGASAIISVIFIIVGGVNYMTSGGDSGKVKKAKDTILYATIGLVICALAFAIVNWVLGAVLGQ